ncbi:mycothiol synthase [Nesterenkonia sp. NBAIMH1]|uniref:mycothiol synthase n=1 Tax=Nesterenkonia sp. NBAIMH1 TaxID=2600320 RepID=UPI0011B714BD|nr:mycothiol synthase [Nesterenkonia sp. NBAIMH1]
MSSHAPQILPALLNAELADQLLTLADAAHAADGAEPFNDETKAQIRAGAQGEHPSATVIGAWSADGSGGMVLTGAGLVLHSRAEVGTESVLELVVHPEQRGRGIGTALMERLSSDTLAPEEGRVRRAWAHGGHPAAARLAARWDWEPVRELWVMRHTDPGSLPDAALPDGVRIRRFMPGHDEDALLRVNAAAFADHPEQGRLDLNDLRARMAEEWFDPAGLLMAWEDGALLGFHWTKVPLRDGAPGPVGEVYVVGVSPDAQGRGLGKQLTLAGVQHMASQGRTEIILYVDAANAPAVGLYRRLGFEVFKTDTQYAPAGTF